MSKAKFGKRYRYGSSDDYAEGISIPTTML